MTPMSPGGSTPQPPIDRSRLGSLTKLGGGGQGDVYRASNVRISFAASAAFKEYKPAWRGKVDFSALEAMAAFLGGRSFTEGSELVERVAWPTKLVSDAGVPVGFLMPEVPAEFLVSLVLPSGARQSVLAGLQLLLNPPSYLARRGIAITERDRYLLAGEIAEALALFHRYDIAVGDLSPKNVLFSLTPSPRCFFVDADAMRLAGRSALPQAETPDWEIAAVSSEQLATPATDRYKLGLLALRLLAGDQSTRDPSALAASVPSAVRQLIAGALAANPASRPAADDWVAQLRAAATVAKTTAAPPTTTTRPQAFVPAVVPSQARPAATQLVGSASIPAATVARVSYAASRPTQAGRRLLLGLGALALVVALAYAGGIFPPRAGGSGPTSGSFYFSAATDWSDSGIAVHPGDVVTLSPSGTYGVAGSDPGKTPQSVGCISQANNAVAAPTLSLWSVVGRIGTGPAFCIGAGSRVTSAAAGDLFVTINDDVYGDNWGGVTVDWQIARPTFNP